MWSRAVVCGLVANNVGPVANIVGQRHRIVAVNVVPKRTLFASQAIYDCGPLQLTDKSEELARLAFYEGMRRSGATADF